MDDGMQGDASGAYSHALLRLHMLLNNLHNFCVIGLISGKPPSAAKSKLPSVVGRGVSLISDGMWAGACITDCTTLRSKGGGQGPVKSDDPSITF